MTQKNMPSPERFPENQRMSFNVREHEPPGTYVLLLQGSIKDFSEPLP